MCSMQVTTSRSPATGLATTWGDTVRGEADAREATAAPPARACPGGHGEELTDEHPFGDELTVEEASRLAVTALAADLEFWARAVSVDGWVGVNDLIRTLDLVREAGVPAA
jgi:hypothetical protein